MPVITSRGYADLAETTDAVAAIEYREYLQTTDLPPDRIELEVAKFIVERNRWREEAARYRRGSHNGERL